MAQIHVDKNIEKAAEILYNLSLKHNFGTVFHDMLLLSLAGFSFGSMQKEYDETVKKYKPEEFKLLAKALHILIKHYNYTFPDLFGELYEYTVSRWKAKGLGQFFTPQSLCYLMSSIVCTNVKQRVNELKDGEYIRVSDPCSGSGRMFLSYAKVVYKEHGISPKKIMFYGNDVDPICALMTACNLAFNNLRGYVVHGNCLTCEAYKGWHIGSNIIIPWVRPLSHEDCEYLLKMGLNTASPDKIEETKQHQIVAAQLELF